MLLVVHSLCIALYMYFYTSVSKSDSCATEKKNTCKTVGRDP